MGKLFRAHSLIKNDKPRRSIVEEKNHLYVLWTNDNPVTAEKMVFMYTTNALRHGWWENVTLIVWGATVNLVCENETIRKEIQNAMEVGVHVTACKACADQLGATEKLMEMGIEVKYWGQPLTELLKNSEQLLTI